MGKHIHKLTEINPTNRTAMCFNCGFVRIRKKAIHKSGKIRWGCINLYPRYRGQYKTILGKVCERCGFVAENRCQLDIHHVDHNHKNDNPENLQTLCANCHRLITWKNATKIFLELSAFEQEPFSFSRQKT